MMEELSQSMRTQAVSICDGLEGKMLEPSWAERSAPFGLQLQVTNPKRNFLSILTSHQQQIAEIIAQYGVGIGRLQESDCPSSLSRPRWVANGSNPHHKLVNSCWHDDHPHNHGYVFGICIPPGPEQSTRSDRTGFADLQSVTTGMRDSIHMLDADLLELGNGNSPALLTALRNKSSASVWDIMNFYAGIFEQVEGSSKENRLYKFLRTLNARLDALKRIFWIDWEPGTVVLFSSEWRNGGTRLLHAREVCEHWNKTGNDQDLYRTMINGSSSQ